MTESTNIRTVRKLALVACLGTFVWMSSALAQDAGAPAPTVPVATSKAPALKAEGDALMDENRFADAHAKYREAYQLNADPALLYNMGRSLEALNRNPEALEMLRAFDAKATPELHARVPNLKKLIDDVEGRTTMLTVEAPAGTTIKMGSVVLGKAPLAELRVNAGNRVRFEASKEGFDADVQEVELVGRGKARLKFELTAKDKSGLLAIDSPVKGATVFVDAGTGRQVPTEVRVLAGKHTIKLTATGYRDNTVDVEVAVGERKPIIIEPGEAPVYERWYFWTTIGLVAAAGAGGGVLAAYLIEGSPDEGTIPPGQVSVQSSRGSFAPLRARTIRRAEATRRNFTVGPVPVLTVRF